MNYSVTFFVDGNRVSHYEQLAVSSDCSESFYVDPEMGVTRPYVLWCASRADDELAPGHTLASFGEPVNLQEIGINDSSDFYERLQKVTNESDEDLERYYYPAGSRIRGRIR